MARRFPSVEDYIDWLDDTTICFAPGSRFHGSDMDRDRHGMARGRTGRFGVVFKLIQGGQFWALKCFTEPDPDRVGRYRLLNAKLKDATMNWVVPTELDEQGIRGWPLTEIWPTLTMPWIGGSSLIDWLDEHVHDREAVERCRMDFARTMRSLEQHGLAHGDLQSDNVLVEAGDRIRLIDYDGMYVPGLETDVLRQSGMSSFQHPAWEIDGALGPTMDRFPTRLIHLSLLVLTCDPGLWGELHEDGSNGLILEKEDLASPRTSTAIARLYAVDDPGVRREVTQLLHDLSHSVGGSPLDHAFLQPDPLGLIASGGRKKPVVKLVRTRDPSPVIRSGSPTSVPGPPLIWSEEGRPSVQDSPLTGSPPGKAISTGELLQRADLAERLGLVCCLLAFLGSVALLIYIFA